MPKSAALVKVDFDVITESALEVELIHGNIGLVGRGIGHLGLAEANWLAHVIGSHHEAAALEGTILGADVAQLLLRQLFKYYVQINYLT